MRRALSALALIIASMSACSSAQTGPCEWEARPSGAGVYAVGRCNAPVPGLGLSVPVVAACAFEVDLSADATVQSR